MELMEMEPSAESSMRMDNVKYRRLQVTKVEISEIERVKKITAVRTEPDHARDYNIILKQDWYGCDVQEGDIINVVAEIGEMSVIDGM